MKLCYKSSFYLILLILLANQVRTENIIAKESCTWKPTGEMLNIMVTLQNNHQPFVTTTDSIRTKSVCEGDVVTFNFTTNDSDIFDSLSISWNNALPGASWSNTNGKNMHPTATLSWTPPEGYGSSIPYTFAVTVKDNAHPIGAFFTQTYQIKVLPKPEARIIITDSCCFQYWFMAQRIKGSGPKYEWEGKNFIFTPKIGALTYKKFTQVGVYPFKMTMTDMHGCSRTYYDSIVNDQLKASLPADTAVCKDEIVNLNLDLYPKPHNFYLEWRLGSEIIKSETNTNISIKVISDTTVIGYASISEECTCMGSADTMHIKMLNCTSVNEQHAQGYIRMSPNPATDQVNLSTVLPGMKFQTISVYNNLGKLSQQFDNIGSDRITIYRINDPVGVYFVKISLINGEVINTKLLWR